MPHLSEWEKCVADRKEFSKVEKKQILLSDETLLGLRMTGKLTDIACTMYACGDLNFFSLLL